MNNRSIQVYLAWRPMEHRLAAMAYRIENFLWGDARAQHTCLILATDNGRLLMIEIDVEEAKYGLHKSMKLIIKPFEKLPNIFSQIELIGTIDSFTVFEELLRLAEGYVTKYPKYHTLRNNCRTFIDYLVLQLPEIRDRLPQSNGSVLEYYHAKAKLEHPGVWMIVKRRIEIFCYFHSLKGIMFTSIPFFINDTLEKVNRLYILKIETKKRDECHRLNYS